MVSARRDELLMNTNLTGRVDDVAVIFDALVSDTLGEGILDGRVVRVDELVLGELYDEG